MSGFDSETATAPTDELVIWPSVTGAHLRAAVRRLPEAAADRAEIRLPWPSLRRPRRQSSGRRGRVRRCAT